MVEREGREKREIRDFKSGTQREGGKSKNEDRFW